MLSILIEYYDYLINTKYTIFYTIYIIQYVYIYIYIYLFIYANFINIQLFIVNFINNFYNLKSNYIFYKILSNYNDLSLKY